MGVKWGFLVLLFVELPTFAVAAPWPTKLLHRLVAPFRSNPIWQDRTKPCSLGFASCFLPDEPRRRTTRLRNLNKLGDREFRPGRDSPTSRVAWWPLRASLATGGEFDRSGYSRLRPRHRAVHRRRPNFSAGPIWQHRANFGNASGAGLGPATPELPVRKNTRGRAPSGQTDPANGCAGGHPHPKNTPSQVRRPLHPDLPRLQDIRVQRSGSGPRTLVPTLLFAVQRLLVGGLSEEGKCTTSFLHLLKGVYQWDARPPSRPDSTRLQFTSVAAYRAGGMRDAGLPALLGRAILAAGSAPRMCSDGLECRGPSRCSR